MPLISVILPVYNSEKYIAEAVQSILDQTYTNFELIIINDCSTDHTLEIIKGFSDSRIRLINNSENLKVVRSLNKGLQLAKGEYIARMDADDISFPQRFEKQVQYFKDNQKVDVCGTWVYKFGNRRFAVYPAENHNDLKVSLLFHNVIIHPSVMFKKDSLEKHGLHYEESYTNAEDYGLWAEAIDKLTFGTVPQFLLKYRIHGNNVSVHQESNWEIVKEMNYKVFRIFLNRLRINPTEEQLLLHINIGFKLVKTLTHQQLQDYVHWLSTIVSSNKNINYFDKKSLQSEVTKTIIFFTKSSIKGVGAYFRILSSVLSIYSLFDLLAFLPYQLKRRGVFNKRISDFENASFLKLHDTFNPEIKQTLI